MPPHQARHCPFAGRPCREWPALAALWSGMRGYGRPRSPWRRRPCACWQVARGGRVHRRRPPPAPRRRLGRRRNPAAGRRPPHPPAHAPIPPSLREVRAGRGCRASPSPPPPSPPPLIPASQFRTILQKPSVPPAGARRPSGGLSGRAPPSSGGKQNTGIAPPALRDPCRPRRRQAAPEGMACAQPGGRPTPPDSALIRPVHCADSSVMTFAREEHTWFAARLK